VVVSAPASEEDALAWFTAEQATLLAIVSLADSADFGARTWQLAWP